ncbi:hypothetical protein [Corynebacterium cystitidis]|uniref:hypothetical protein n=1 Tax=Corynebacterium cystitidis TaxID=35757 RepID=UPI00211F2BCA|nr:hypothetical protein [Corynebacterium cystitidis]
MKSKMWFSDVYPNIEWINFTVDSGGKSMIQEEKNGVGHDTAKLPAAGGQLSSLLANLSSSSLVVSEPSRG